MGIHPVGGLFITNESPRHVSALPGGNRNSDGNFNNAGNNGNWWTATWYGGVSVYTKNMNDYGDYVYEYHDSENFGHSVRCVRDRIN